MIRVVGKLPSEVLTQRAVWLDCERVPSCGRWVKHTYIREDPVMCGGARIATNLMFRCMKCGTERVFGQIQLDKVKRK